MQVYLGGYSPNVEQATFNDEHLLSPSTSVLACNCATYLRQDGRLLFAIKRLPDRGGVAVFDLKSQEQVGEYLTPGASPAYLGINVQKKLLYVANYHTGWLTVLHYNNDGKLQEVAACQHKGHSVRPEQTAAHPHFFDETPAGHLVSCDLGTDCLDFYKLVGHDLKHLATWQAPAGSGVRHAVFANGLLYVVCELASQLLVVAFDETNMRFKLLHSYSTVANSYHGHNGAAALRLSSDGRFVYVSNRGEDTMVVFAVKKAGLQLIQRISTFGHFPRDFNWDSKQRIVVAANQESSNATVYKRDCQTGLLTVLQKDVPAAKPTCVLFGENKR
jgi:6-phosphogluconolactonase